jgi:gentisate 1,2-dioxygenase
MADRYEELAKRNLLDELIALRDKQRELKKKEIKLVKGEKIPWEHNKLGRIRWYLHPTLDDTAIRSLLLFVQEIPPGARTGRFKFQGGQSIYIWEGKGHSLIDGVRYDWQGGDVVNLPLRRDGVIVQHFNDDAQNRVRFVACELNLTDALGVDRGCGFEIIEEAP